MALTLSAAIGWNDSTIVLSGGTIRGDVLYVLVDSEEMLIVSPPQSASQTAGTSLIVQRAFNGTSAAPHTEGAAVTPMYVTLSATPGG
jgi:hypothetical protein